MGGAREEEAVDALVRRLSDRESGSWTFAELFLLGDRAVDRLEQFIRDDAGAPAARARAVQILAAIATPTATVALTRALAATTIGAGTAPAEAKIDDDAAR